MIGKEEDSCYWCRDQARFLVEFDDVPVDIRVCGWHVWPYMKHRSRPCIVTELNGDLTSV